MSPVAKGAHLDSLPVPSPPVPASSPSLAHPVEDAAGESSSYRPQPGRAGFRVDRLLRLACAADLPGPNRVLRDPMPTMRVGGARGARTRARARRACAACNVGCWIAAVSAAASVSFFFTTMALASYDPLADTWAARHSALRGVNLGGWLLAERWLVGGQTQYTTAVGRRVASPFVLPSPWGAQDDEYALSEIRRRENSTSAVYAFRDAFMTAADVALIADHGINTIRVPFGYWVVAPTDLPGAPRTAYPYLRGRGMAYLDDVVEWAAAANLTIIFDLHGAPGSQNGKQTSGHEDASWEAARFCAGESVAVLEAVAERYANAHHVIGMELLNEPELPLSILLPFYQAASDAIRKHMPPERVAVVINLYRSSDVYREAWAALNWHLPSSRYPNIIYDLHIYYAFFFIDWIPLDWLTGGITVEVFSCLLSLAGRPSFVGEWSLSLPWYGRAAAEMKALSPEAHQALREAFATRQIRAMTRNGRLGGYLWTWFAPDAEDKPNWSLRDMLLRGYIKDGQWAVCRTAVRCRYNGV